MREKVSENWLDSYIFQKYMNGFGCSLLIFDFNLKMLVLTINFYIKSIFFKFEKKKKIFYYYFCLFLGC